MKYINNRYSVFAGFLLFVLTFGVFVHANNPSVTVSSNVLPAFESQPSAQSSGLSIDVLGIPTGNSVTLSPSPAFDPNRLGPNMVLGFGQVVYDQTDFAIKGLDEVTNLVIARRHLSRRDQTKTILNEEYSSGSLTVGVEYQWVDVSGNPDFSTVGAGDAPYSVGDTFTATSSTVTPTWGTAKVQLANQVVEKHSPFGPSWAFNYNHTITRYGDDVIMESYGRRDRFTNVDTNVWEGSTGRFGRLTYDTTSSPAKYILRMPHGTILEFGADNNAVGKPAHLTKIISPNDILDSSVETVVIELNYDNTDTTIPILERKLLSITDSFGNPGRNITFTYGDNDYDQGVSKITDFSNREFTYDYDTDGRLLSVTSPAVNSPGDINKFPNGKTYEYQYLESTVDTLKYLLKAVIFPNQVADSSGTPRYAWTYDENSGSTNAGSNPSSYLGYVKTYTVGPVVTAGNVETGKFSYTYRALASFSGADSNKPLREVKVKDRKGTETVYNTNNFGQVLSEEVKTSSRSYTRSFKYNNDGQLTLADDAMGSRTQFFYANRRDLEVNGSTSNTGNPRNVEFPMTDMVRIPDSRGADQEFIRSRTIYEPVYNKPYQTIDPRGFEFADNESEANKLAIMAQYTTTHFYDYMEDLDTNKTTLAESLGIDAAKLTNLLPDYEELSQIGETNNDGNDDQIAGNVIKIQYPNVTIEDLPNIDESTLGATATASETLTYNDYGLVTRRQDPEGNVTTYRYYKADGSTPTNSAEENGYLHQVVRDADTGGDSTTPVAQTTTYEYVEQTFYPEGDTASATFPANPRGVPTSTIDPRGTETVHYINELDQVAKAVRDVSSASDSSKLAYETVSIYDANNNVVETHIENEDTLDSNVDDFIVTEHTYDLLDQVTKTIVDKDQTGVTGEVVIQTEFDYDANQNLIGIKSGDDSTSSYDEYSEEELIYDERDFLIQHIHAKNDTDVDAGGSDIVTTEVSFEKQVDANGYVVFSVDGEDADTDDAADGFSGGDPTKVIYDGFNRKTQEVDRSGNRTVYSYDSASNMTRMQVYGSTDETSTSEELLAQTDISYDERNRAVRSDRHLFHYQGKSVGAINDIDSNASDGLVTTHVLYDALNRTVGVLDAEGDLTKKNYDGLSRLVESEDPEGNKTQFTYDSNDNVLTTVEIEVVSGGSDLTFTTSQTYDILNRQTSYTEPNGSSTAYAYDSRDNLIKITDVNSNVKEMTYDRVNRPIQEDTYLSLVGTGANDGAKDNNQGGGDGVITISTEWDDLGRVIAQIDDNDDPATTGTDEGARVEYSYDDLGRKISCKYEDNTTETWTYDGDGNITVYKDRNGTVINRTYDAKSRLLSETFSSETNNNNLERAGTTERRWTYDGQDRVTSAFDNNGDNADVTCFYTYDSLSQVTRVVQRINNDASTDLSIDTEWEGAEGHKIKTTYPNGRIINRSYDDLSRLSTITEPGATQSQIASYTYAGTGRIAGMSYGNSAVQTKTYDNNRRVTVNNWKKSDNSDITNYAYTYNATNRIASENRQHLSGNNFDSYTFDSAYRMTGFREDGSAVGIGGALSSRTLNGADMMTAFTDVEVDSEDDLSPVVDGNGAASLNRYTQFDGKDRLYDSNGSLDDTNDASDDSADLEYIQDYLNRIVEVGDGNDATIAEYAYDASGRRILKTVGSTTTRYLYDGWQVIEERNDSEVLRQYVSGSDLDEHIQMRSFAADNTSSDYYYHSNESGFVGALTDDTGEPVEYYEYEWLGEVKVLGTDKNPISDPDATTPGIESSVDNPYTFQGRRLDTETGLYYYRNRYYSPVEGQFVTVDPLGMWNHGQGNGRSAFDEDPINNKDPLGLAPITRQNAFYAIDEKFLNGSHIEISKTEAQATMAFARANNVVERQIINLKWKLRPKAWKFGGTSKEQRQRAMLQGPAIRKFMNRVKYENADYKKLMLASDAADYTHYALKATAVGLTAGGVSAPAAAGVSVAANVAKGASGVADIMAGQAVKKHQLNRAESFYGRHEALADYQMSRGAGKIFAAGLGAATAGASPVIPDVGAIGGSELAGAAVDTSISTGITGAKFGVNWAVGKYKLKTGDAELALVRAVQIQIQDNANLPALKRQNASRNLIDLKENRITYRGYWGELFRK